MTPSQNTSRTLSVKKTLYAQEMSNKGTTDGPQSRSPPKNGLKYIPMKTDPILTADYPYDYRMELLDRFTQVSEPDEKLVNKMFQAFETLIAVGIGDEVFVRRCYKWPYERIHGGRRSVMTTFYVDTISYVRVNKDPQGNGLKIVPLTAGQVRDSRHSSNYERDLQDLYFEVTLNRNADEQVANELFQEFGALIAVNFKNGSFTRNGGFTRRGT